MTFETVMGLGHWVPIKNCPGRSVLHDVSPTLSLRDLLGPEIASRQAHSLKAKDTVWIIRLEDGGIISYARPDGSWLHTLNTTEGFERKLRQLGIEL
jgi:hypothetical protein